MSLVYTADSIVICVSCILVHVDVRLTHSGGCFHTVYHNVGKYWMDVGTLRSATWCVWDRQFFMMCGRATIVVILSMENRPSNE